ncbi:MAG TPA: thiol:disulfide interchange protein DsbA/DsbL [Gammaproteobacteria bacterium]|nr:thiol:disulfide interchange protein DsbA/DsbL [Gammaproteobacteria bacterium]
MSRARGAGASQGRRAPARWGRLAAVLALAFAPLVQGATFNQVFREGVDYVDIYPPAPTSTKKGVEVVEVFWYGCDTCYLIQPYMRNWIKTQPRSVHYRRMPGLINAKMDLDARAFYAAKALGVVSRIHQPLFKAIHEDHRELDTKGALAEFFDEQGIGKQKFLKAFNSPAVASQMFRARNLTARYGIKGVPSIIVNGRYYTDPTRVKSPDELVMVVNFLVKQEMQRLNH